MKLLDEKGLETVWATCKVKFALAGHTHKLSQLTNDKGFVTGSVSGNTITINGVSTTWTNTWRGIQDNLTSTSTSDSLSANQGKVLKGLVDSKANSSDLSSYPHKDQAVSLVQFQFDDDGSQYLKTNYADGRKNGTAYMLNASPKINGCMSKEDKVKLDGIASGANNYSLPTASTTTLGGIKTSVDYDQYHCFPICTDTNGVAYAKIDAISQYNGAVSSFEAKEYNNYTVYNYNEIINKTGGSLITLRFPSEPGTLALTSDIPDVPDVSDLCKTNLTYDISKCKEGSVNIFINNSGKDFSVDSIKDKYNMVVFAYVTKNCNITSNVNMILYNNVPNFTGKVSVTPGMFLIIPNLNQTAILSF